MFKEFLLKIKPNRSRKKPAVKNTFLRNVIIYLADKKKGKKQRILYPSVTDPLKPYPVVQFSLPSDNLTFLVPGE